SEVNYERFLARSSSFCFDCYPIYFYTTLYVFTRFNRLACLLSSFKTVKEIPFLHFLNLLLVFSRIYSSYKRSFYTNVHFRSCAHHRKSYLATYENRPKSQFHYSRRCYRSENPRRLFSNYRNPKTIINRTATIPSCPIWINM